MRRFIGRHAAITGAGTGIGQAVAATLAREGAALTLIGRSAATLEATAAEARAHGAHVTIAAADVRDEDGVEAALAAGSLHAPIDLLITAAGVDHPGPLTETSTPHLRDIIDINVTGTLITCRAFMRRLPAGTPGAVVCLSSQMGVVGFPGRAAYCASKHAVNGLTKALALEWVDRNVRVNAVAPTFVETPLTAPMLADPAFAAEVRSRIPLGRVGTTAEVSSAVLYLLSPEASLITGHVLAVDGGWTAV